MPYSEKLRPIQPIQTCHTWAEEFQKRNKKKLLHCVRLREVEYREELNNQTFPSLNCGGLTCSYCLSFLAKKHFTSRFCQNVLKKALVQFCVAQILSKPPVFSKAHFCFPKTPSVCYVLIYIYIYYIYYIYIYLYIHIYIQSSEVV